MAGNYHLSVTAGPDYDLSSQQLVHVNTDQSTTFSTSQIDASITFRIQNYRGLPTDSPKTCNYFSAPGHKADLFSLQFSFVPKSDINGNDVVLGNDFDYPIRDGLPPGADQAFKIAKWFIDPGMYADVKADKPHVFGPLLSSINTFRIDGDDSSLRQTKDGTDTVQEGTTNGAESERVKSGLPSTAAARKKHFLDKKHLESFTFKAGTRYTCDFFNPYLDFNGESRRGTDAKRISADEMQTFRSNCLRLESCPASRYLSLITGTVSHFGMSSDILSHNFMPMIPLPSLSFQHVL